ncbi:hypothetical protein BDZ91DRAFT_242152 [Kalaharituber pfeilii]|nr:hypothetical protein BDZ91DRAFT_242152 [Kalaharituber pfeilii]
MGPESRIGFEIAIGVPCVLLIFLRAWVLSRFRRARFGNNITNAALYLTCLCVVATNACNIWTSSKLIEARHRTDLIREPSTGLPLQLVPTALKISFALKCFYVVGLYAVKAAFLGIFVELEQHLEKKLKVFVKFTIWATVVLFTVNFLLTTLWCVPFDTNWTLHMERLCSSLRSMVVVGFGTASNVLTDLCILAIPLFVLKTLPLRRREMYAIAFVFFLVLICVVASIVRFIFLWDFIYGDNDNQLPSQQNIIVYTSELEVVIAVWAGCLPALRALLRRPSRNGTTTGTSGAHQSAVSGYRRSIGLRSTAGPGSKVLNGESQMQVDLEAQQKPQEQRNLMLARGFGYGEYDPDAEEGIYIEHKLSIESERDGSGSEVELRHIPPSPRSLERAHVR